MASIRVTKGTAIVVALGALVYLAYLLIGAHRSHEVGKANRAKQDEWDEIRKKREDLEHGFKDRESAALVRCLGEERAALAGVVPDAFALKTTPPTAKLPHTQPAQIHEDNAAAKNFDIFIAHPLFEGVVDCWPTYPEDQFRPGAANADLDRDGLANIEKRMKVLDDLHPPAIVAGYDVKCDAKKCDAVVVWIHRTDRKLLAAVHVTGKAKGKGPDPEIGLAVRDVLDSWTK